jgi:hypothetical protein
MELGDLSVTYLGPYYCNIEGKKNYAVTLAVEEKLRHVRPRFAASETTGARTYQLRNSDSQVSDNYVIDRFRYDS